MPAHCCCRVPSRGSRNDSFPRVARTRFQSGGCAMRLMRARRCANSLSRHYSHIKLILRFGDENSVRCYEATTSSLSLNKRTRPNTCYVAPVAKEHRRLCRSTYLVVSRQLPSYNWTSPLVRFRISVPMPTHMDL